MTFQASLTTPFGMFTLVADEMGLCALHLPSEQGAGAMDTRTVAPADHPLLAEAGRQLQAYLQGRLLEFNLPLSIHGTPFQQLVWRKLMAIPYGQTRTYGELAERIGGRGKARAVGGAAHANPLAIVIPCHRLIGAGGKLTGFAGGLPLKKALLDLEQRTLDRIK
ncbi:methylated-DNA--[protein]-cysteine S-methyltransferase [Desulfobulbus propionicus]|jgi:O-6-methylguanine DNA methyltransferase